MIITIKKGTKETYHFRSNRYLEEPTRKTNKEMLRMFLIEKKKKMKTKKGFETY